MPNYVKTQLFNYADSSIYPYAIIDSIRYDASTDTSIGQDALRKFLNDDYAGTLTPPRQLVNIDEFAGFKSTTDISINNVITRINNIDSSISDISTSLNTLDSNVGTLESSIVSLNNTATGFETSVDNLDASMALAGLGLSSVTSLYNMPYVSNTINATVSDVSVISFDITSNDLTKLKGRVFSIHITPTDDYVQILTNGVQRVGTIYYNMHSTRYLYEAKSGYGYILKLTVYSVNNNNVYVNIDVENELADSNLYYKTFITRSTTNNKSYVFSQQYQSAADSPLYIGDVSVVRKSSSGISAGTDSQLIFCDITGQHQYWLYSLYLTDGGDKKPYIYYSYLYSSHDYGKTFGAGELIFEYDNLSTLSDCSIDGTCSKNGECVYISCYNNSDSNAIVYSNTSYGNGTFTDHLLINNFGYGKDIKIVTDYTGKRVCCFLTGYSGNNSYNKMYVSNDYGTTFDEITDSGIQGPVLSSKMYIASSWDLKTIYLLANSTTQTTYNLYTYKYSGGWTTTSEQIDVSVASSTSKEGININCNYDGSKYMIIQSPSWNNNVHSGTSHNGYVRYFYNGVSADSSWNTTDSYSGYFKNVNICSDVLGNNSFVSFSNIANVFSNIPINTFYNINNGVIADTSVNSQLFVDPSSNSTNLIMIAHSQI